MLDKMSDASRLVDRLLKKGLVERKISSDDRRKVDVIITKKGLKLLSQIDELNSEFDRVFKNINKQEAHILNDLLDKMRE